MQAGVDVVPVTLLGTGDLMPSGGEGTLRPGKVIITVHKPIPTKGRSADQVGRTPDEHAKHYA
jgi:1-acyl-sn-glycerol-3-phosphate acyltransferase